MRIPLLMLTCVSALSISSHQLPDIFYHSFVSPDQFSPAARTWVAQISTVAQQSDLQAVLELLLISYERSQSTREAQHAYLALLEKAAAGWNHLVTTRRNPSTQTDFNDYNLLTCSSKDFYAILHEHDGVQNEYRLVTERLVVDKENMYPHVKPAITQLRTDARASVGQALSSSLSLIQQELSFAHKQVTDAAHQFGSNAQFAPSNALTKHVLDTILAYVPGVLMKSFVIFDQGFVQSTRTSTDAFFISQTAGNFVWHIIECSRAAFYASYYHALYASMDTTLTQDFPHPDTITERFNRVYACH